MNKIRQFTTILLQSVHGEQFYVKTEPDPNISDWIISFGGSLFVYFKKINIQFGLGASNICAWVYRKLVRGNNVYVSGDYINIYVCVWHILHSVQENTLKHSLKSNYSLNPIERIMT